jgi:hypothetical protein
MRVRFNGGPWDGVEFEAPFCPDVIGFRHTDVRGDPIRKEGKVFAFMMHSAKRNHHQYRYDKFAMLEGAEPVVNQASGEPFDAQELFDSFGDVSSIVMHYRYAPTEGAWWEQPEP